MDNQSFFSIDRLVEFGLGMAVAQQMVGMMNQTMRQMYVPGSIQSMPQPAAPQLFYVALESKPVGPLQARELSQMITDKKVNKDTLVWMPGMPAWKPVEQVPEVLKLVALAPPPLN
jgi:hypothetical protein